MKFRTIPTIAVLFLVLAAQMIAASAAKDEWLHVRSTNFNLIGNASEKEIRRVGTKLEQFREAFRALFSGANLSSPIPTNVIVFKSDSSYKPFKPKRGDGKIDNFIAGYFQPGEDVNYITLAAGGADAGTFGTIYHEYVHFIVNTNVGKSGVPAWFNEGLAEYYSTFLMEDDIKATLGIPDGDHLNLLRQNKLIPLDSFFNTSNAALHGHGSGTRSVFYAQAWATVHYLIANNKTAGIGKYLDLSMKGTVDEAAFQEAFQMSYAEMEKELRKYVGKGTYLTKVATFKNKMTFDAQMTVAPMTDADSNAYLGDLLYHTNRAEDAEPFLQTALVSDPDSSMANTSMGMVKVGQRKFAEAKTYLDKAIAKDPKNHLAFYHAARLLSREGRDEFGYISEFPSDKAARMRQLLKRAIEINPSFTESYEMLAFVSLVTNEGIDDAIALMVKALRYQPGNQRYAVRIAELYLRQEKFDQASALAARIAKTTDDEHVKSQADNVMKQVSMHRDVAARNEEARKRYEAATSAAGATGGPPRLLKPRTEQEPSPEELRRQEMEFEIRGINRELRKSGPAEVRVLGKLEKVDCKGGKITYTVVSDTETFTLTSKDFQGLNLSSYVVEGGNTGIGCDAKTGTLKAVLIYQPSAAAKSPTRGELVSVEFVPAYFRFVDAQAQPSQEAVRASQPPEDAGFVDAPSIGGSTTMPPPQSFEEQRRNAMVIYIKENLRKPAAGEIRVMGFIERSECSNKGAFFYIKTPTQILKLNGGTDKQRFEMKAFTPDIENLQVGCGMKPVEIPVVVTYRDTLDKKNKANGDLVAVEFVPKSFVLEP
jgi:tetratricopeptide (TPR) repeat protein